jgi:type IV secretion system protein VirB4
MFRLDRIRKPYDAAGSLNEQVNLFGFVSDHAFLTKSGDLGLVMSVAGVDYECLDSALIDHLTKRLGSALKIFDENCRVYQYLFKPNRETVPHESYENPVVSAAVENRIRYLRNKAHTLYSPRIYYVLLLSGTRQPRSLASALARIAA